MRLGYIIELINKYFPKNFILFLLINTLFIIFSFLIVNIYFDTLKAEIPLWYTKHWGTEQLSPKGNIYWILIAQLFTFLSSIAVIHVVKKMFMKHAGESISILITMVNVVFSYSIYNIVRVSSEVYVSIISDEYLSLIPAFLTPLLIGLYIGPSLIKTFKKLGIVTKPTKHKHPGMILKHTSTRGGGIIFMITILITAPFFIEYNTQIGAILLAAGLLALIGFLDDYQNTNPNSKIRIIENPIVRLSLMFLIVSILPLVNITFSSFSGIVFVGDTISIILTIIWVIWVLNILSWSNGIDGQYSGIITIIGVVLMILSLRYGIQGQDFTNYTKLALLVAGASMAVGYYNWFPSKTMWGFGATSAGFIIVAISIGIQAKVATTLMITLIPFIDGCITVIRRIYNKQNPLKADKGHLHHILLSKGWGVRRTAVFYWLATLLSGFYGILIADIQSLLAASSIFLVTTIIIILLNVKFLKDLNK
jgi:UDP-GlcNAc:undecaprenyl-phosphate GlcNAc-1-phosphate transferase